MEGTGLARPSSLQPSSRCVNNPLGLPCTRLCILGDTARDARSSPDQRYQAGKDPPA